MCESDRLEGNRVLRAGQTVAFGLKSLINAVLAPENILGARVKLRLCVSAMISTQETVAEKVIALNTERKKEKNSLSKANCLIQVT